MSSKSCICMSSLQKKFLMAITGVLLFGFVIVHMLGNLQVFLGPDAINLYAYKLHSLPAFVMWGARLSLLLMVGVHILMAVKLTIENKKSRPREYDNEGTVQASYSSRTMPMTGLIVLSFIIFHILHYTSRVVPGMEYDDKIPSYSLEFEDGSVKQVFDVYAMIVEGFSNYFVSFFYILSMGLLCMHLSHGLSSMFQTLGLRNKVWRPRLNNVARATALFIFIGFAAIPISVFSGVLHHSDSNTYSSLNSVNDVQNDNITSEGTQ